MSVRRGDEMRAIHSSTAETTAQLGIVCRIGNCVRLSHECNMFLVLAKREIVLGKITTPLLAKFTMENS